MVSTPAITEPEYETPILRDVMVAVTALRGGVFYRANTGVFRTMDGKRIVRVAPPGIGDIMGGFCGRAVAIETKTLTGRLRKSQIRFQKAWEAAGNIYIIARSAGDALAALAAIDRRNSY